VHTTTFRLARVAIVIVLAIAGYFLFVRTSHIDRNLLGKLAIHSTPVKSLKAKPSVAHSLSLATNSEKVVKQSAKTDPAGTGLYEIEWASSSKAPLESGLLIQLLPDTTRGATAYADSKKQLSVKPQLSGETLASGVHFVIPSVPGAIAESYAMTTTSTGKPGGYAFTALFRLDRVVVTEIMETASTTLSTSAPSSIASAEYSQLQRAEPGFSMTRTTTPVIATIVYWVVALLIAVAAFFVPEFAMGELGRRRARHEERERARARSEYRARGRRAVRRHRAPAWRQTGRR